MQALAVREGVVRPPVYGSGGNALRNDAAWPQKPDLHVVATGPSVAQRQPDDDWDNGDPPDLMLWGEE